MLRAAIPLAALAIAFVSATPLRAQTSSEASPSDTPIAATSAPPVRSRIELDAYLRATAATGSPLDALSPHGRKRFLASLIFTGHGPGVGGASFADLRAQLTEPQIAAILNLFGLGDYAQHIAASAPDPSSRDTQSQDAIEDHFDAYEVQVGRARDAFALPRSVESAKLDATYGRSFAPLQTATRLEHLPSYDVHVLFRAASETYEVTALARSAADMALDVRELGRRRVAEPDEYVDLVQTLLATHDFAQARAIAITHPSPDMPRVPAYRDASKGGRAGPTILTLDAAGTALVRRDAALGTTALVVVASPGCHFCAAGIKDIERDPQLWPVFEAHALWLVPPGSAGNYADYASWNREHPHETMTFAFDYREWRVIPQWDLPNFYVLRNDAIVAHVHGWPVGGNLPALRSALRSGGLLP